MLEGVLANGGDEVSEVAAVVFLWAPKGRRPGPEERQAAVPPEPATWPALVTTRSTKP